MNVLLLLIALFLPGKFSGNITHVAGETGGDKPISANIAVVENVAVVTFEDGTAFRFKRNEYGALTCDPEALNPGEVCSGYLGDDKFILAIWSQADQAVVFVRMERTILG